MLLLILDATSTLTSFRLRHFSTSLFCPTQSYRFPNLQTERNNNLTHDRRLPHTTLSLAPTVLLPWGLPSLTLKVANIGAPACSRAIAQTTSLPPFARTSCTGTNMSAYTTPTGNYPPPHGAPHSSHQGIQLAAHNPDNAQSDPLSSHHGLHVAQPYQYDAQPSQQSPYNNGPSASTNTNTDADNIQYQAAQYQGQPVAATATGDAQKANRLRKACDSCSVRKVKVFGPSEPQLSFHTSTNCLPSV